MEAEKEWEEMTWEEKREERFKRWLSLDIKFDSSEVEKLYRERITRFIKVIKLEEPDRVPVMSHFGFFPARYAGITFEEAMYDSDKMMKAWLNATVEFEPDMYENPYNNRFLGQIMESLDFKQLKWPGHGTDVMSSYQYLENEYMKGDEYDSLLFDMTDFIIRTYWPRIFGALESFKRRGGSSEKIQRDGENYI